MTRTRIELCEYPSFTFYDNGYLQAWASHNQGKAGDTLWPYTLYRYDTQTETYLPVAMVDAWDRSLIDTSFPEDADRSGTGVIYYVMEPNNYDLSSPMDANDFNAWLESWQAAAKKIVPSYLDLTENNITKEVLSKHLKG